jgi:hypothetical protein
MNEKSRSPGGERRNARRFPIKTPLSYRIGNEEGSHYGTTENISKTGISFRCEQRAKSGDQLEIGFVLPISQDDEDGAWVVCSGEVVRCEPSLGAGVLPSLAVKILQSQLLPLKGRLEELAGPHGGQENDA